MDNILIPNPEKLQEKIERFQKNGAQTIHILTDFDSKLTKRFVNEVEVPSIISKLRNTDRYLGKEYAEKAKELYAKYHPFEVDPNLDEGTKRMKMLEWWSEHYKVLEKMGMSKQILDELVNSEDANFREGALEFLDRAKEKNIPVIIISSSGIGDAISMFLKRVGRLYDNIHIISNRLIFDDNGKMTGVKDPIIHSYNKNEVTISQLPISEKLKDRKNVVLLGNSLGDLGMIEGINVDEVIRVGFLNTKVEENQDLFLKNFDVVITNDGSMDYLNNLLAKID